MKIDKAVDNVSTITELKRIASPYVIDYRGLNDDEIREALKKTAPQYYYQKNVEAAIRDILLNSDRNVRLIAPYILKCILLQADGVIVAKRERNGSQRRAVFVYEQEPHAAEGVVL